MAFLVFFFGADIQDHGAVGIRFSQGVELFDLDVLNRGLFRFGIRLAVNWRSQKGGEKTPCNEDSLHSFLSFIRAVS